MMTELERLQKENEGLKRSLTKVKKFNLLLNTRVVDDLALYIVAIRQTLHCFEERYYNKKDISNEQFEFMEKFYNDTIESLSRILMNYEDGRRTLAEYGKVRL